MWEKETVHKTAEVISTGLGWKWKGVTGDPVHIGNDCKY